MSVKKSHILIVDDRATNRLKMSLAMTTLGYSSEVAEHGARALELLRTQSFDLVLLDILMPEMDGHQVLAEMKSDSQLQNIAVIVISSLDDMENIVRCIELGAEDYLSKDFEPALLKARIGASLEKKQLRDSVAHQLGFIREAFGKYVPESVVQSILEKQGPFQPVRAEATILFTDIIGFTSISESFTPEKMFVTLNEYFPAIMEPITRLGGVVNQFLGDGMFVTFNVPVSVEQHADLAVKAALEIQNILAGREFQGVSLPTRIGIHTGNVIAGAVGSGERINYTVYGDAVNIAARLEQLNKEYGTHTLVSNDTVCKLQNDYGLISIGEVTIRGKLDKVQIHSLA